jgi:hypothetical protein
MSDEPGTRRERLCASITQTVTSSFGDSLFFSCQ